MSIAIVVHGGAGTIPSPSAELVQAGCKQAALIGWYMLRAGCSALDTVEVAVRLLEDDPCYNAGTGSSLTSDGKIELDAGIMDGQTLQVGAVAAVELIKNPIALARKVLESPHALLVGQGAQQFAQEQGMPLCAIEDLRTERQYERWRKRMKKLAEQEKHGTVGAVALDQSGRLVAGTSTGGISNKHPGRVGDSSLVGCGFYADDKAAISCTGYGEDFIRLLIAVRAAEFVACGNSARDAAIATVAVLTAKASSTGGLIIVDHLGNVGFAWNSPNMVYAYMLEGMEEPIAGV